MAVISLMQTASRLALAGAVLVACLTLSAAQAQDSPQPPTPPPAETPSDTPPATTTPPTTTPPATAPSPTPPPVAAPGPQEPTTEWVQSRLDDLAANSTLDAAIREQATTHYKAALSRLEAARASAAAAAEFRRAIETAPAQLAEVREQLAALAAARQNQPANGAAASSDQPAPIAPDDTTPIPELEQRLTGLQVRASEERTALSQMEESLRAMLARPESARKEVLAEKQTIADLEKGIAAPAPTGESAVVSAARLAALQARRIASTRQVEALEQELLSLPARQDLLTARRDLAATRLSALDKQVADLQTTLTARRQDEARKQLRQAEQTKRELADRHPVLAAYAEENALLTRAATEANARITAATAAQANLKSQIDQLAENEQFARQLLDISADGAEYGSILRELRAKLPNTTRVESEIDARESAIVEARLQRLRIREQLRALADVDAATDALIAPSPDSGLAELRPKLRELVVSRKETLTRLADGYNEQVRLLTAANADARDLTIKQRALESLLTERLMWLPSTSGLSRQWWSDVVAGTRWLTRPQRLAELSGAFRSRLVAHSLISGLALLTFTILLLARPRIAARFEAIAERLRRVTTDSFALSVEALGLCFLLALPWPLLLVTIGAVFLRADAAGVAFPRAFGMALVGTGIVVLILRSFHAMCRPSGLFISHFRWGNRPCTKLRGELRWLMGVEAAATIAFVIADTTGIEAHRTGLGRLAFLVGSLGLAIFMYRTLSPRRGATAEYVASKPLLWRLRFLWYPLAVAIPAGLGVLAALGYQETAGEVQSRVFTTGWISLVTLIAYSMSVRWLLITQRRIAYKQAIERREKARAAREKEQAEGTPGAAVPQPEEPQIDIQEVSQQTRTLLRFAVGLALSIVLWAIWSKLFPAMRVLDQVTLWTHAATGPDGETVVPVTAWSLAIALFILVVAWVSAKNLPGLIEIAILQRLAVTSGTRYTIATITRYSIVFIGLLLAFNTIGADWSKMQWIVAALGVGLGFGLQEIVANFVSGLIILFEQPVRVGDLVTVGDQIGMVSRIKIRATTIIDPDNREVIIPNKAFITERVTNWALNDPVTRLLINIGIAYGSDTQLAHDVLLEAVKSNPLVLDNPAPAILFMGFGDSALNFEARVYVREIGSRIPLTHELNMAMERALRENGIEIPFPQRTVHLKGLDALNPNRTPAEPPTRSPSQPPTSPATPSDSA